MSREKDFILTTLLGAGAGIAATLFVVDRDSPNQQQPNQPENTPKNTLVVKIPQELTNESQKIYLSNYSGNQRNFEDIFKHGASISGDRLGSLDQSFIGIIRKQALEHVIEGAYLANLATPPIGETIGIEIRERSKYLIIGGQKLNLDDNWQFQLAASLVLTQLEFHAPPRNTSFEELAKQKADLAWLAQTNINITVEPGSFAIIPKNILKGMAQILQDIQPLGIPFPEIRFKVWEPGDPGAGYDDYRHPTNPFRITLTNTVTDNEAFSHEVGHYVSDVIHVPTVDQRFAAFSQEAFETMIRQIQQRYQITDSITKEKNLVEEYANTFSRYYREGDEFRREIITVEPGSIKRIVLLSEYQFIKALWQGREFRQDRIPVERLDQHETINIGDFIQITDTNLERPGIFLRPTPTLEIGPNLPTIWDNYKLLIIDGPVKVTDQFGNTHEIWKVKLGATSYGGDIFFAPRDLEHYPEGWISREWFGRKITFKEVRTN